MADTPCVCIASSPHRGGLLSWRTTQQASFNPILPILHLLLTPHIVRGLRPHLHYPVVSVALDQWGVRLPKVVTVQHHAPSSKRTTYPHPTKTSRVQLTPAWPTMLYNLGKAGVSFLRSRKGLCAQTILMDIILRLNQRSPFCRTAEDVRACSCHSRRHH